MGVREPNAYAGAHIICHVLNDVIKLDGNSGLGGSCLLLDSMDINL